MGSGQVHTSSRETDDKDTWEGLRCDDVTGQGGGQLTQNQEGVGEGSLLNPSLEIKEKAGGWCWVALRLSPGDCGWGGSD